MSDELDWFRELLGSLGPITVRRMFGGAGFYADGRMVALEADGILYLKVDEETRPRFADVGGSPFVYDGKGKTIVMSYWTVPDEAMDSAEAMRPWAKLALQAASRAGAAKPATAKKSGAKTAAVKKVVAKKATAKNVVAKKAVTKSATTKSSARATKPAARKATAKKNAAVKKTAKKAVKKVVSKR